MCNGSAHYLGPQKINDGSTRPAKLVVLITTLRSGTPVHLPVRDRATDLTASSPPKCVYERVLRIKLLRRSRLTNARVRYISTQLGPNVPIDRT